MSKLELLINEMRNQMTIKDLPDEYLKNHNHTTRDEIGMGEYSYGITMVPCSTVFTYLREFAEMLNMIQNMTTTQIDKSGISKQTVQDLYKQTKESGGYIIHNVTGAEYGYPKRHKLANEVVEQEKHNLLWSLINKCNKREFVDVFTNINKIKSDVVTNIEELLKDNNLSDEVKITLTLSKQLFELIDEKFTKWLELMEEY